LKRDGTIRSNGKCLTAYGFTVGQYVMIYNCSTAATDATIWQVRMDGSIISLKSRLDPRSRLALSAPSGSSGTTLILDNNTLAPAQGWLATNNTQDLVTRIVGFSTDLCLYGRYGNGEVWMGECGRNKWEQWVSYPDGSIRPNQDHDFCLTCENDHVFILSCSAGRSSQRWMFKEDGTILNLFSGMVMEVKISDPSLYQIIMRPPSGNPNQKWLRIPIP